MDILHAPSAHPGLGTDDLLEDLRDDLAPWCQSAPAQAEIRGGHSLPGAVPLGTTRLDPPFLEAPGPEDSPLEDPVTGTYLQREEFDRAWAISETLGASVLPTDAQLAVLPHAHPYPHEPHQLWPWNVAREAASTDSDDRGAELDGSTPTAHPPVSFRPLEGVLFDH